MARSSKKRSEESKLAEQNKTALPDTAKQIESLRALAAEDSEICAILGVAPEAFEALKADPAIACAYEQGSLLANQRVTESLFAAATAGNVEAQKFWLSSRQPERWNAGKIKQPKRTPEPATATTETSGPERTPEQPPDVPADPNAPPPHLGQAGRAHWQTVVAEFVIEAHDRPGLQIACEALDEIAELQAELQQAGDETTVEKTRRMISRARNDYRRSMRELGLSIEAPKDSARPPAITGRNFRLMGGA